MEALRQIPPINDILESPQLADFRDVLHTAHASRTIEDVLRETRRNLAAGEVVVPRKELTARIATAVAQRLKQSCQHSLRRVINASGVVVHTNLGRSPLPPSALDH